MPTYNETGVGGGLAAGSVGPPIAIAWDTFTDTVGTDLSVHVPDSGGSWSVDSIFNGDAVITAGNRARQNSQNASVWVHSAIPPGPDYDVQADVVYLSRIINEYGTGVVGRWDASSASGYAGYWSSKGLAFILGRYDNDAFSSLGSYSAPFTPPTTGVLTLSLRGSTITLSLGGSPIVTATDTTYPAAGKAGLYFGAEQIVISSDSTGAHLDNWSWTSASPAAWVAYDPPSYGGGLASGLGTYPNTYTVACQGGGLASGLGSAAGVWSTSPQGGGLAAGLTAPSKIVTATPSGGGLASGLGSAAGVWSTSPQGGGLGSGSVATAAVFVGASQGGGLGSGLTPGPLTYNPASQGGGLASGQGGGLGNVYYATSQGGGLGSGRSSAPAVFLAAPKGGGLASGLATASGDIGGSGVWYNVYANTGAGDPINYATPIATLDVLTWTSTALTYPGVWKFGVRAENSDGEEKNVDCIVVITLSASGLDISAIPAAPLSLTGHASAAGAIVLDWHYQLDPGHKPTAFHVYQGTGGSPSYTTPVATVPYLQGVQFFTCTISGLTNGVAYTFGVRAYNATGEEANTMTATVTADGVGPSAIAGLAGVAIP